MITEATDAQAAEKPSEAVPVEAGADLPERLFAARTWKSTHGDTSLVLEETAVGDTAANMWVAAPDDGPSALLAPKHMRELAATLVRRADKIDPPENRWEDVPRTPGEVIESFLSSAKTASERTLADDESPGMAHARIMTVIDGFTVAALMAELEQVAPDRAAMVAEQLGEAYFDGGSVDEWLFEWIENRAQGKPIGFNPPATLPFSTSATEAVHG